MTSHARAAAALVLAALAALAGAPAARAQSVFSPGELSRAHRALEGLGNCTRCHVAGEQLLDRCLACHTELRSRVAEGRGFHGRIPAAERACERCHHEHQGRDFPIVDWGRVGKKGFDHARAGFELRGRHRRVECARCHDRRLVRDPAVLEVLGKQPARETLLGAPTACAACHFDEHRGQLGSECQRCHGEDGWKPAPRFAHARTSYPLEGKHGTVPCAKCHRSEPEPAPPAAAPGQTAPVSRAAFVRYKGLPFQACTDCHKDPHQGRLGMTCAGCHTPVDWRKVSGAVRERAFHDRTRYPLRGAHAAVRCEACHGPSAGAKARFRGLAFDRCTDCHADAHSGQLETLAAALKAKAAAAPPQRTCDACHGLDRWTPARFEADDHERLTYRLEGAHRAVACALCHPKDAKREAAFPERVRAELRRQNRPVKVSLARFDVPRAGDCRTCHRDPHAGQFDARLAQGGCAACHGVESFRRLRFDHAKDSRFPLTGKHDKAACVACHRRDAAGVVRYRPLDTACAACHADAHAGQLAVKGKGPTAPAATRRRAGRRLRRSYSSTGGRSPRSRSRASTGTSRATSATLPRASGRWRCAATSRCRPSARAATSTSTRARSGVPPMRTSAMRRILLAAALALSAGAAPARGQGLPGALRPDPAGPDLAPRRPDPVHDGETRCVLCHTPEGWEKVTFSHDGTGFPLEGRHREATCRGCHPDTTFATAVPRACAACHPDVHQGRLGRRCEKCHDATGWKATTFDADAHRRSAFPSPGATRSPRASRATAIGAIAGSRGRHASASPATRRTCCGPGRAPRWITTSPASRATAAAATAPGASSPPPCRRTRLLDHPRRARGDRCRDCHTSFPPVDYQQPFTCQTDTAACVRCHSCAEHEPVGGFACANRRCYECHRFSTDVDGEEARARLRGGGLP